MAPLTGSLNSPALRPMTNLSDEFSYDNYKNCDEKFDREQAKGTPVVYRLDQCDSQTVYGVKPRKVDPVAKQGKAEPEALFEGRSILA